MEAGMVKQSETGELLTILKRCLPDAHGIDMTGFQPVPGGGNNRLYCVEASCGPVVLKRYFRHPGDPRDRFESEYGFSTFLWEHGIRNIPEPLARDDETGTALYRFVEGRAYSHSEIHDQTVCDAQKFLNQINEWRSDPGAVILPDASESCFTIQQHLDVIEKRVQHLFDLPRTEGIRGEAASFVRHELQPAWTSVRQECIRHVESSGLSLQEPVNTGDRILSPSDFGFHNALQTVDGPVFLDFEYAGWDDSAKTVCDFFCQIAVPVPIRYWEEVSRVCAELTSSPERTLLRMRLLLPVYRIKWVCITLNHFLAVEGERRRFATGGGEMLLTTQLGLAERLLSSIQF